MKRLDGLVGAPGGRLAPLRRAGSPEEVGRALAPGVIVETDPETASACGAADDSTDSAEEAFEAAEDPSDFWTGEADTHGPV